MHNSIAWGNRSTKVPQPIEELLTSGYRLRHFGQPVDVLVKNLLNRLSKFLNRLRLFLPVATGWENFSTGWGNSSTGSHWSIICSTGWGTSVDRLTCWLKISSTGWANSSTGWYPSSPSCQWLKNHQPIEKIPQPICYICQPVPTGQIIRRPVETISSLINRFPQLKI